MSRRILTISCLAGACASLALPPISLGLAILALSYPLLQMCKATDLKSVMKITAAMGMGWFTASTHWVAHSLLIGDASFMLLLPVAALGAPLLLTLFWIVAGIAWRFGSNDAGRLTWILVALCLVEFARGHVATGFPWNSPGYLFSGHLWLLQAASWVGLYGLTLLAFCFAAAPAYWCLGKRRIAVVFALIPVVVGLAGGARLAMQRSSDVDLDMAGSSKSLRLVQPVIPQAEKWDRNKRRQHFAHIVQTSSQVMPIPQLMIWPETAFSTFPSKNGALLAAMIQQALPFDGYLITGLPRLTDDQRLYNSAALIDATGKITAIYDKKRLVPFGEFAPLRSFLPFVDVIAGPIDFSAGVGDGLMDVPNFGTVRVLICYEVIFPGQIIDSEDRPDVMVNITNDAWFGNTLGPRQHLAQARMRAVEEGIPLVRAANNGISAGFDGLGQELGRIDLNVRASLDLMLPPPLDATIFARFKHVGLFIFISLLGMLALRLDREAAIRQ